MLDLQEIQMLITLVDAGVRATGVQVFSNGGGVALASALRKLEAQAGQLQAERGSVETPQQEN